MISILFGICIFSTFFTFYTSLRLGINEDNWRNNGKSTLVLFWLVTTVLWTAYHYLSL